MFKETVKLNLYKKESLKTPMYHAFLVYSVNKLR